MKLAAAIVAAVAAISSSAWAAPVPGQPAPAFRGVDVHGKPVTLADFRGKTVVLEWNNPNCPFVQKHYTSGNMQALQQKNTAAGVVWLAVNSTTESHSDYMVPAQLAAWFGEQKAAPTAIVMDPKGEIGRAYGAKVTPHMYVIDPKGTLVYAGAIDDKRSANPADVKTATNHVTAALGQLASGKAVTTAATTAYGCTIKY
ncbi:MAG TPA: redoxin domain-containing protein [Burkholderiaceae bacterium]|nr:redoxin domain-containing protein [Burkholderiaceae bacterium]